MADLTPPESSQRRPSPKKTKQRPQFSSPTKFVTFLVDKIEDFEDEDEFPTKFIVHKEFACHYSPVLRTAFNGNFVESKTQCYKLSETTSNAVQLLVQWLYFQKLELGEDDEEPRTLLTASKPLLSSFSTSSSSSKSSASSHLNARKKFRSYDLASLWVLADKLLIPQLQNVAIRELAQRTKRHNVIPTQIIPYIWQNTPEGSPLRQLLLHYCTDHLRETAFKKRPHRFPKEMLLELVEYSIGNTRKATWRSQLETLNVEDFEVPEGIATK